MGGEGGRGGFVLNAVNISEAHIQYTKDQMEVKVPKFAHYTMHADTIAARYPFDIYAYIYIYVHGIQQTHIIIMYSLQLHVL